jgi:SAM-dependent methyltransferase
MFFPERIKKILPTDKVLEIGPGAAPHPRADVFLEKTFNKEEALVQSGYAKPAQLNKKVVFYDGTIFPFENDSFDYVICSHVIEHVPIEDLFTFISEMQRISKKGYIEFPTVFYELINYEPVHIWLMNFRNDKMIFLDKRIFESNNIHKIIRSMFYGNDLYLRRLFSRYQTLFFVGFEWEKTINYEMVKDFNELVNDADLKQWECFFKEYVPPVTPLPVQSPLYLRAYHKLKRLFSLN